MFDGTAPLEVTEKKENCRGSPLRRGSLAAPCAPKPTIPPQRRSEIYKRKYPGSPTSADAQEGRVKLEGVDCSSWSKPLS